MFIPLMKMIKRWLSSDKLTMSIETVDWSWYQSIDISFSCIFIYNAQHFPDRWSWMIKTLSILPNNQSVSIQSSYIIHQNPYQTKFYRHLTWKPMTRSWLIFRSYKLSHQSPSYGSICSYLPHSNLLIKSLFFFLFFLSPPPNTLDHVLDRFEIMMR